MNDIQNLERTHVSIIALHDEMKLDAKFKALCIKHGLPWDFAVGYEPRWYNGPSPKHTKVLFFMAEPGAITETEKGHLLPAIKHEDWIGTRTWLDATMALTVIMPSVGGVSMKM